MVYSASLLLVLITLVFGCGQKAVVVPKTGPSATKAERIALYRNVIQAYLDANRLPIIDLELMLTNESDLGKILEVMDDTGVALAAVTSKEGKLIRHATEKYPARFIPLTPAPRKDEWTQTPTAAIAKIRRHLKEGAFGFGRIPLDIQPRKNKKNDPRDEFVQKQKKAFEILLRMSSTRKIAIWVQMNPEDNGVGWLESQLRSHADARIIWTRAGYFPTPEKLPSYGHGLLRAITLRRPNLFMTLTVLPPAEQKIFLTFRKNLLYDPGGGFSPEWRTMIEARIVHFGSGSSLDAAKVGFYQEYMRRFRNRILNALTKPSRERLAWKNAWRFITGSEWAG